MTGALMIIALFAGAPAVEHDIFGDCADCHTAVDWRTLKTGIDGFDHDQTDFSLRGAHLRARCDACHRPDQPVRDSCVACHADTHGGDHGGRCDDCHDPRSWRIPQALTAHRRTRMPLRGGLATLRGGRPQPFLSADRRTFRDRMRRLPPSRRARSGRGPVCRLPRRGPRSGRARPRRFPRRLYTLSYRARVATERVHGPRSVLPTRRRARRGPVRGLPHRRYL